MVVRNLRHSLLSAGPASSAELVVEQNGTAPRKRTRVAVLISGTGVVLFILKYMLSGFSPLKE